MDHNLLAGFLRLMLHQLWHDKHALRCVRQVQSQRCNVNIRFLLDHYYFMGDASEERVAALFLTVYQRDTRTCRREWPESSSFGRCESKHDQ